APVVGWQRLQGSVGKDATLRAGRELTALVGEPMKALDDIDRLPGFVRSNQRRGEADSMKRHVVLAEKLYVPDVVGLPPPASPITARAGSCPFLRRGDVADRRIEPDIKHLALETGTRHGNAPGEIACDAAIPQRRGQPALRSRHHEGRPACATVDP